ncbi:MAG: acyl-CoA dehydrogenase family protein [Pseudonocardia sp.]|nr:acyl-CoA dehydrogenase family protein [Pseudonocardia sp.]
MDTETDVETLQRGVEKIEPVLRRNRVEAEEIRRLPEASVTAMREVGLYRMWTPRSLGGLEIDPVSAVDLVETISRIDAAAGWNLFMSVAPSIFGMWLSDDGAREVYADEPILAGALFPPVSAVPTEGGYRVSGRVPFVSGCHAATWLILTAMVIEDGAPRLTAGGDPVSLLVFLPRADGEIIDNWDTLGMRGTGSHDVAVTDLFVPEHRTASLAPFTGDPPGSAFRAPLYRLVIWEFVPGLAMIALGIAGAAIGDLVALAKVKTPAYTGVPLRERPVAQSQIAQAEGHRAAARAYVRETLAAAYATCEAGEPLTTDQRRDIQLAACHAVQAAATAVRLVHDLAGSSAIRNSGPFSAHFRNVHTVTQHAFASASRYESVGQLMLGLPPEWPFFAF